MINLCRWTHLGDWASIAPTDDLGDSLETKPHNGRINTGVSANKWDFKHLILPFKRLIQIDKWVNGRKRATILFFTNMGVNFVLSESLKLFLTSVSMANSTTYSTHCSGDWQEAVVADENNAEDRRRTKQVVHDQPQLTQSSTQRPPACEDVGDVHRDAKCS